MKFFFVLLSFMIFTNSYSQRKVDFNVTLLNGKDKDVSQYLFKIKLVNKGFDQYWVQDTSFLATMVESPFSNLIHPILWRKVNGKYKQCENFKNRLHSLPQKCLDSCCNCLVISKGDSLTFTLKLLECCNMDKGQYKMITYIRAPMSLCEGCDQIVELESNYVYFTVQDESKRRNK